MHTSMHLQHTRPEVAVVCCLACVHAVSSGVMADARNDDEQTFRTFKHFERFSRHINNIESRHFASQSQRL